MDLCLITPVKYVWLTRLLPGRFCLAQIAIKHTAYREFFRKEALNGYRVILDNGAFENDLISDKDLIQLAEELSPTILIVPDLLGGDAKENFDKAVSFAKGLSSIDWELMFVPQCKPGDTSGYEIALVDAIESELFKWIGIARVPLANAFSAFTHTTDESLNKFYFGAWAEAKGIFKFAKEKDVHFHMLGIGNNLSLLKHCWWAETADTASLFFQATLGNKVCRKGVLPGEISRPKDYFLRDFGPEHLWLGLLRHNCKEALKYAERSES